MGPKLIHRFSRNQQLGRIYAIFLRRPRVFAPSERFGRSTFTRSCSHGRKRIDSIFFAALPCCSGVRSSARSVPARRNSRNQSLFGWSRADVTPSSFAPGGLATEPQMIHVPNDLAFLPMLGNPRARPPPVEAAPSSGQFSPTHRPPFLKEFASCTPPHPPKCDLTLKLRRIDTFPAESPLLHGLLKE